MKIKHLLFLLLFVIAGFTLSSCNSIRKQVANGQCELHHIFPRQFSNEFSSIGINVDQFTVALTKNTHRGKRRGIHHVPTNYNNEWYNFLTSEKYTKLSSPEAKQKACYKHATKLFKQSKFVGKLDFYDYNTKKKSDAIVAGNARLIASAGGFWGFCQELGLWAIRMWGGTKTGDCILSFFANIGDFVLGIVGVKAGHPVSVGVGILVVLLGLLVLIGFIALLFL